MAQTTCFASFGLVPVVSVHDTARVLNHMNQPISSCRTYYEEILQIAETAGCRPGSPEIVQSDWPHEMDGSAGSSRSSPISRPPSPMATDKDSMIITASETDLSDTGSNSPFVTEF
jgi:hypothetical protein